MSQREFIVAFKPSNPSKQIMSQTNLLAYFQSISCFLLRSYSSQWFQYFFMPSKCSALHWSNATVIFNILCTSLEQHAYYFIRASLSSIMHGSVPWNNWSKMQPKQNKPKTQLTINDQLYIKDKFWEVQNESKLLVPYKLSFKRNRLLWKNQSNEKPLTDARQGFAPRSKRNRTISARILKAAIIKGVCPCRFANSISAPFPTRYSTKYVNIAMIYFFSIL